MGARWVKISVFYLLLGLCFGLFMHYTIQLQWSATHAHINVFGWLTTGLMGLIYSVYPKAGNSGLGKAHFWFHNIGLPLLLIGMFVIQTDLPSWVMESTTSVGGTAVLIGAVLMLINVFKNVKGTRSEEAS